MVPARRLDDVVGQQRAIPSIVFTTARILTLVSSVFAFAGCASVRFGSTFTEDETATHTLEISFPRSSLTELDFGRIERQIADTEVSARAGGLTTTRLDNPDLVGLRVINTTEDATDAAAALNSIFNTLQLGNETGPVAPFQGTFERVGEAVGGTAFELELTVEGDVLYAVASGVAPGHPQLATPAGVREVVQIEYEATMPGKITETNGGLRSDSSAYWTIPLAGPTELHARSTVGKDTPWVWTTLTIVGSLAVVAVSAALVWTFLQSNIRTGRIRLPLSLRVSPADARQAGLEPTHPPRSLAEVANALSAVIRRFLRGQPLYGRMARARQAGTEHEERRHGTDAEGD